jgi:hypothetical protein
MATQKLTLLPTAPEVNTGYIFPASGGGNTYKISTGELAGWISSRDINLKSDNYTISNQDQKSLLSFYGGGSYNLVIPSHSEDPIPVGTMVDVANNGTSIVGISGSSGVTIGSPEGNYVVNYGLASLIKVSQNKWVLSGNLSYHPDRYFGNVSLLAHMSGTDGGSSFVDSSPRPKSISVSNDVKTLSTKYKYGPTSAYFNVGSQPALIVPSSEDFNFGSGDFCIELWVLVDAYNSNASRLIQSRNGDLNAGYNIGIGPNGALGVYASSNGNSWDIIDNATPSLVIPLNTWTHIAFCRKNGTFLLFVNGNTAYNKTSSASLYYGSGDEIIIGGQTNGTNRSLNGYIDEVRITKGEGRYSQPFQLNNIPYPDNLFAININPKLIPGLRLWLDGNESSSLYDNVTEGSNVASDGTIARWEDISGENNHAIQNDSNKRPVRKTGSLNSKDTVLFDGSNDCFVIPNFWLQSHFSVFIVQSAVINNDSKFWLEHSSDLNGNPGFYFQGRNSAAWAVRRGSSIHAGDRNTLPNGANWIGDDWSIASFIYNGAGLMYKNGVLLASQSDSGSPLANTIIQDTLNIGSRNQTGLFLNGSIAEIIIYDKPLSNLYRMGIETYLKNKWNIV